MIEQTNIIRNEINTFGFSYQGEKDDQVIFYQGASALEVIIHSLPNYILHAESLQADPFKYISQLRTLELLLNSISKCIDFINNSNADEVDKAYCISVISYQYISKVKVAFDSKLEKYKTGHTFEFPSDIHSESVFTDRLFNIVKEIDLKLK